MTNDPEKPSRASTIVGWIVALLSGTFLGFFFLQGYILNNTSIGMNGEDVVDGAAMIGPGVIIGLVLIFMAFDIKFQFIARAYGSMVPRYSYVETETHNHAEVEDIKPREARQAAKKREQELERLRTEGWAELYARENELLLAWSKYETDVALMIDYPIMTDYTDPVVHKVIVAMQKIRTAKMKQEEDTGVDPHESSMNEAVNEFEIAFQAAERYARRYGQTKLDPREQRKLSTARSALNIILDGSAPSYEIEAAYKSLRSSLKGIIDVPEKALLELEAVARRALETGNSTPNTLPA